jgi:hypothetical protein
MRGPAIVITAAILAAGAGLAQAGEEMLVTAGASGIFPPGATFAGVSIRGLEFAFGLELEDGVGLGELSVVLLGVGDGGVQTRIVIEGKATAGTGTAGQTATFSGTCSVSLVEGADPTPGVPFTATVTLDANDQGTLGLVLGETTLPDATVNGGSMTLSVPPTATPPPS